MSPHFKVTVVDMMPQQQSDESWQDSEPNLSVDPTNPQQIAGTAFTPCPVASPNNPVYSSQDGGQTWNLACMLPAGGKVYDQTIRFDGSGHLYCAFLHNDPDPKFQSGIRMSVSRTDGLNNLVTIFNQDPNTQPNIIDQPFVQSSTVKSGALAGKSVVYVGCNDFNNVPNTATIFMCLDAASPTPSFVPVRLDLRSPTPQDGPQVRTAIHPDGTVYAIFYSYLGTDSAGITYAASVLCRDDNWGAGASPFTALTDPGDNLPGRNLVESNFIPNYLRQERISLGDLAIAVDPKNSSVVYWAQVYYDENLVYTMNLYQSTDRKDPMSAYRVITSVQNATNPSIAVTDSGFLGFLYQQLTTVGSTQRYETHLQIFDPDMAASDIVLATTPANDPPKTFDPYLGDYAHLLALGNDFYGIFCADNTPDLGNFPNGVTYNRNHNFTTKQLLGTDNVTVINNSIDPFFFRVSYTP